MKQRKPHWNNKTGVETQHPIKALLNLFQIKAKMPYILMFCYVCLFFINPISTFAKNFN